MIDLQNILPIDGEAYLIQSFKNKAKSDVLYEKLRTEIEWSKDLVKIYGKTYETMREVAWYADEGLRYTYSGSTKESLRWTPTLLELKSEIEEISGHDFNACLLNYYHSGEEGMGWHSDDEKALGARPVIASLSLGAARDFVFKHKSEDLMRSVYLENGSLLIMKGETQKKWKHALPKRMRLKEGRINLTFRKILKDSH